jgi:nucleoside-diphosphate-sugar epimerase
MAAPAKFTALVLGGTGFIGRNLVKLLLDSGSCSLVRSVDKVFPQTAFLSKEHAAVYDNPACQFIQGNLSSAVSIAKCFALDGGRDFDYVFSCAAECKYGQEEPIYQEKLHDVLLKIGQEAVKHKGLKKFVHLSTAQIYEPGKKPSKEGSDIGPWTGVAKMHLKAEETLRGLGLPIVIFRPATVYGPGDVQGIAPRLICAAVYKHLNEKMKFLWSGDLRVNTVHVIDVCRAMLHAATSVPAGTLYNLCDKNDTDQEKICKVIEAVFGISTGFYGAILSSVAKVNLKSMAEDVNDKHLKPWSELCKAAGIATTPLTPYLDPELLYNNSLSIDGSAIEATGFKYQFPNLSADLVRQQIKYHVDQHLFPITL